MRRIVAAVLIGLLGLVTPAWAQSSNSTPGAPDAQNSPRTQSATNPDVHSDRGTDAFAQAPPPGGVSPFLIIGGIAGGAGLIAYAISQSQSNEQPTSP